MARIYCNVQMNQPQEAGVEGWKEGKDGKGTQHLCSKCRQSKPGEKMWGIPTDLKGME